MSILGLSGSAPEPLPPAGDLQFERAEFVSDKTGLHCTNCGGPAGPEYHELASKVFCGGCRQKIEGSLSRLRSSGSVSRALLYGLGAAVVGSLIFYAVTAITGIRFGLIAVVVGWMVGKAVRQGSGSLGGRRYQVLAVLLTYMSIASTNVPAIVKAGRAQAQKYQQARQTTLAAGAPVRPLPPAAVRAVVFYGMVFVLAMAVPFLMITRNILGVVIIGIGLWEAWKFTRAAKVEFSGPFTSGAPPSAAAV
jgi:hypothetical protein